MQIATFVMAVLALTAPAHGAVASNDAERKAVVQVVTDAYINGVHAKPDPAAMRRGFHPDFRMLVLTDGTMNVVTLDEWAGRVEKAAATPQASRPAIRAEFPQVDISGAAASVRVEVFRGGTHTFTDYLLLYRFADGWNRQQDLPHAPALGLAGPGPAPGKAVRRQELVEHTDSALTFAP